MYPDLKGKIAVVTGGSKGLGAAIAARLGAEGVAAVIAYHSDQAGAERVKAAIEQSGGRAVVVQADVGAEEGVQALRDAAVEHFGGLHIWVNDAGVENSVSTHEMPLADWQKVINVNLTGVFLGSRTALKHFIETKTPGNIINISSVHEIIPWPKFAHYAASKGGVGQFTRTIAMEYAERGIRVNNIGPGAINTPINAKKFADPEQLKTTTDMVPMKTIGEPEDVAAAAWLASDQSKYVTGITLYVDGGMTLYPAFMGGKG